MQHFGITLRETAGHFTLTPACSRFAVDGLGACLHVSNRGLTRSPQALWHVRTKFCYCKQIQKFNQRGKNSIGSCKISQTRGRQKKLGVVDERRQEVEVKLVE
jgi:hypothetical protein